MQETWIKVKGFELYSVSDQGNVRNDKTGRILKGGLDKDGYPQVILCKNGSRVNRKVHRLVAEAFVPNPDNKPQVNHIDGNKQNNYALSEHPRARKVLRVNDNKVYNCLTEAALDSKTTESLISHVCQGKRKTTGGYNWKYI